MTHIRRFMLLIVAALLSPVAAVSAADVTQSFPLVGVLNSQEIARVNAVLAFPQTDPCPVTLTFFDEQGGILGTSGQLDLVAGSAAAHLDFTGTSTFHPGTRLEVRAQVVHGDPDSFRGCRGGVLLSLEILDKGNRATRVVLTNPLKVVPPLPTGTIDFSVLFASARIPLGCQHSLVAIVKFEVFDAQQLLRTSVSRPCVPDERYLVTLDAGPYTFRVQGLNAQQTICYEVNVPVTVQAGATTQIPSIVAQIHPTGLANGCTYP